MDIATTGLIGVIRSVLKKIFTPITDGISKLLFREAYEISTLWCRYKDDFVTDPKTIFDSIEYKIYWREYRYKSKLTTPMIWIRAKDGLQFTKVLVTVEAKNPDVRYQSSVTIRDLDYLPIEVALPSIPFRKLRFEPGCVFTPYRSIKTTLTELYDNEGNKVELSKYYEISHEFVPSDSIAVAKGDEKEAVEIWKEIYNLKEIELEVSQILCVLRCWGECRPRLISDISRSVFGRRWVAKMLFWSRNIFTAKDLTRKFDVYIEKHQEDLIARFMNDNSSVDKNKILRFSADKITPM